MQPLDYGSRRPSVRKATFWLAFLLSSAFVGLPLALTADQAMYRWLYNGVRADGGATLLGSPAVAVAAFLLSVSQARVRCAKAGLLVPVSARSFAWPAAVVLMYVL